MCGLIHESSISIRQAFPWDLLQGCSPLVLHTMIKKGLNDAIGLCSSLECTESEARKSSTEGTLLAPIIVVMVGFSLFVAEWSRIQILIPIFLGFS